MCKFKSIIVRILNVIFSDAALCFFSFCFLVCLSMYHLPTVESVSNGSVVLDLSVAVSFIGFGFGLNFFVVYFIFSVFDILTVIRNRFISGNVPDKNKNVNKE